MNDSRNGLPPGFAAGSAFTDGLTALADRLPQAQSWVQADPARLAGLEQELERELTALIIEHFGSVRVLAEEHFSVFGEYAHPGPARPGAVSFAVDPLDGSKTYARGLDRYAVSVAGCVDGKPVLGFVYQPSSGTMYSAALGAGAYANGLPLVAPRQTELRRVCVGNGVISCPSVSYAMANLRQKSYELEPMESTSLKLCWLAVGKRAGLVKLLVERDGVLRIWGSAAGQLIAREAGVDCVGLDRGPWQWAAGPVTAGDHKFLTDFFAGSDNGQ